MPRLFLSAIAMGALTLSAAVAQTELQEDLGPEELAGLFFAPPESTDATVLVTEDDLQGAGAFVLASRLGRVERALSDCKTLRYQMETLIGASMGSYSVHPEWINRYKSCIVQRNEEVKLIGSAIKAQQSAVIGANEGEAALRAADVMARLTVYQTRMKKAVKEEYKAQQSLISYYNSGGTAQPPENRAKE
ncbi:hypothetical protein [Parvularcula sp. LCG005]|uniref:hypothetical protein n=1 Tax=Parvularcula sp. LCG005 TaxID=3078805 RepID=UPI00294273BC|nr:hypothetical protein [Parvularcula sp. LCG005]WOI54604.1 hypothetical protein RUI03_06295 [Parvularcula sp. LCG005]